MQHYYWTCQLCSEALAADLGLISCLDDVPDFILRTWDAEKVGLECEAMAGRTRPWPARSERARRGESGLGEMCILCPDEPFCIYEKVHHCG
jgi:hypothetical protein